MSPDCTASLSHFAFMPLPNFTMIAFMHAIWVIRMANDPSGQPLYRWSVISPDGGPVKELFVVGRDRIPCTGVVAPLDMMPNLIAARMGTPTITRVADPFSCENSIASAVIAKREGGLLSEADADANAARIDAELAAALAYPADARHGARALFRPMQVAVCRQGTRWVHATIQSRSALAGDEGSRNRNCKPSEARRA